MVEEQFSAFVADDAERWFLAKARHDALVLVLQCIVESLPAETNALIVRRLRQARDDLAQDDFHQQRMSDEIANVLGEAPTSGPIFPSGEPR